MATDYLAAQKRFRLFKSALTRATNTKDPHKVIAACDAFFAHYERADSEPFPDDWHRWERARDDARYTLQRQTDPWKGIGR